MLIKSSIKSLGAKVVTLLLIAILGIIPLIGCSQSNDDTEYPEYAVSTNSEIDCIELSYDGVIYRPYGVFPNNKLRGKQIGIRGNDTQSKICEVKGYSSKEWITEYSDAFMGGGDMLFKAVGVTEIPEDLKQYKEYDY